MDRWNCMILSNVNLGAVTVQDCIDLFEKKKGAQF